MGCCLEYLAFSPLLITGCQGNRRRSLSEEVCFAARIASAVELDGGLC